MFLEVCIPMGELARFTNVVDSLPYLRGSALTPSLIGVPDGRVGTRDMLTGLKTFSLLVWALDCCVLSTTRLPSVA